jgi:hypothetical protein
MLPMTGMKIEELTASGFVKLIIVDVEEAMREKEDQDKAISEMTELLYDTDKFYVISERGIGICIKGIATKTFRVTKVFPTEIK